MEKGKQGRPWQLVGLGPIGQGKAVGFTPPVVAWRSEEAAEFRLHVPLLAILYRKFGDRQPPAVVEAAKALATRARETALAGQSLDSEELVAWAARAFEVEDVELAVFLMSVGLACLAAMPEAKEESCA